jgi:hypothetical protein
MEQRTANIVVNVIAVFCGLAGLLYIAEGFIALFRAALIVKFLGGFSTGLLLAGIFGGGGAFSAVIGFGLICAAGGLWMHKRWAWIIMLVLCCGSIFLNAIEADVLIAPGADTLFINDFLPMIIESVVAAVIGALLGLNAEIRELFTKQPENTL